MSYGRPEHVSDDREHQQDLCMRWQGDHRKDVGGKQDLGEEDRKHEFLVRCQSSGKRCEGVGQLADYPNSGLGAW